MQPHSSTVIPLKSMKRFNSFNCWTSILATKVLTPYLPSKNNRKRLTCFCLLIQRISKNLQIVTYLLSYVFYFQLSIDTKLFAITWFAYRSVIFNLKQTKYLFIFFFSLKKHTTTLCLIFLNIRYNQPNDFFFVSNCFVGWWYIDMKCKTIPQ